MKRYTRLCSILLVLSMIIGLCAFSASAAKTTTESAKTSNLGAYEYTDDRWANPVNSYLVPGNDGTINRIEFTGTAVVVETYDQALKFVSGIWIDAELPLFGGFHSGSNYNFLVFGQTNTEEDDSKEVIRVVCYTKNWNRVGATSLYGANTTVPFDAGSLRFAEYGGYLYVRTAHEMYTSSDGLNHQSNLTFNVRISDLTITESAYSVSNNSRGYVSHSFNQFIAVDGTTLIAADHGDAHPRAVILTRYEAPAGQDQFLQPTLVDLGDGYYTYRYAQTLDILPIAGSTGHNDTGVSLGGFACSDSSYLVVGNTTMQGDNYDPYGQRNIFITATDKNNFTESGTVTHYLTAHTSGVEVSNPHFVKVGDDKYIVLWTETTESTQLCYSFVDGTGTQIGETYTAAAVLSDCQPIVWEGKLVWYVTNASAPAFFAIDLDDPTQMTKDHLYTYEYASYPSFTRAGVLSSACMICGEAGADLVIPAIQNSDAYTLYREDVAPTCTEDGEGYYSWNDLYKYNVTNYIFWAPIPASGHTANSADNGNGTHDTSCSVCGELTADDEKHTYIDGTCACGAQQPVELIEWYGTSSTLGGKLSLNFYIESAKLSGLTNGYAVLTRSYADGSVETMTIDQVDWVKSDVYFKFTYSNIAAKEMGDVVSAVIYNADGTAVTVAKEDSVATWAMRVLESDRYKNDKVTCTMQVDLLNYGAAAQTYWHYNEKNLVNATLTAEQKALATAEAETVENIRAGESFYGDSLVLEDEIQLKFYFTVAYAEGMTAKATFTDHTGEEITVELKAEKNSNLTQVLVTGMAIADYKCAVTCELYDAEGNVVAWGVDSMASNCSRQVEPAWLVVCDAIMKLGASAYAYFHR